MRRVVTTLVALTTVAGPLARTAPATAAPTTAARPAAAASCTATVFRSKPSAKVWYRIPAVVRTPTGTLVAFAERRHSTGAASDVSDTELVRSRSTDGGCRWSAPTVVADQGRGTVGNPAPVVDTTTGDVLLLSVYRADGSPTGRGLHLQRSTDDGRTFTAYGDAGVSTKGVPHWAGGLTGPGHAIQLHAAAGPHPGRLVVPMGYHADDRFGAYGLLSDDHGAHWRVGYDDRVEEGHIEGTVAELPDGRLWVGYRVRGSSVAVGRSRVGGFSTDGGASLVSGLRRTSQQVVAVQGSALALTGARAGTLLYSSPAGTASRSERRGMTLFASSGSGVGSRWTVAARVGSQKRPAAYSDLVQVDDTHVGVLYETGDQSWKERIDFRTVGV